MICRIYDVVDLKTGEILMKGSTISPLSKRFSKSPYTEPKHKNHKLFLSREWEWPDEDRDFGILLLRIREQFEISRDHLWQDQGGQNISEPAYLAVFGFGTDFAASSRGGIIAMRFMTKEQRLKGLKTLVSKKLGVHSIEWQTSKACQTARIKSGKKAVNRLKILVPLSQPLAVAASHAKKNEEGKSIHAVEMGKKGIKYHSIEEKLAARRKSARDWATRHRRTHPPRSASEELA